MKGKQRLLKTYLNRTSRIGCSMLFWCAYWSPNFELFIELLFQSLIKHVLENIFPWTIMGKDIFNTPWKQLKLTCFSKTHFLEFIFLGALLYASRFVVSSMNSSKNKNRKVLNYLKWNEYRLKYSVQTIIISLLMVFCAQDLYFISIEIETFWPVYFSLYLFHLIMERVMIRYTMSHIYIIFNISIRTINFF